MKILYLFASASEKPGSVQKKICEQIKALNSGMVTCKAVFFSTDDVQSTEENIRWIKVPKVKAGWFSSTKQRTAYQNRILEFFEDREEKFDFVYYRYPGAHKLLLYQLEVCTNKIFFEHVTAESKEIEMYSKENPFTFSLSSLLSYIEFYFAPLKRERKYGKLIRQKALFGICNSDDIAIYEKRMAEGKYKTLVLGDSVNTSAFPLRKIPVMETEFNMLFLKGASTVADFNGLDRVLNGIANYKGEYKLKFYLHGKHLEAETKLIKSLGIEDNVILGAYIEKEAIDQLMDKVHLGISALAVHRKGIVGTTTIKTREYFARGLPFIFGHQDPDFSDNYEALQYCKELPGNNDPIDFTDLIDWYKRSNLSAVDIPSEMREFAEYNLDYKVKMRRLSEYLNEINILGK